MKMGDDNLLSNTVTSILINGIMNAPLKGEKITFWTKVLCFKEISEDIKLECEKYWKVNEIFIPRKDIEENDVAGMGNAYVLFDSVNDAKNVIRNLCCRRFNDRLIRII